MCTDVCAIVPLAEYQQGRSHLFPSSESIKWYVRKHKDHLIEGSAILLIAGRTMVAPAEFDKVVIGLGLSAAAAQSNEASRAS